MSEILYGINPVNEAILAGRRKILHVFCAEGTEGNPRMRKLCADAQWRHVPVQRVPRQTVSERCGSRENQGVMAECEPFPYTPFAEMLGARRMVLLDNMEDPHNIGAIMRTAEVLGWGNVLLPRRGSALLLPSVAKASAGACEYLRIAVNCSANQYVKIAKEAGYFIVALEGTGKAPLEELQTRQPERLLLVAGGEDSGVGQFIKMNADAICAIPQQGHVNSLNASVAAALALYALR